MRVLPSERREGEVLGCLLHFSFGEVADELRRERRENQLIRTSIKRRSFI